MTLSTKKDISRTSTILSLYTWHLKMSFNGAKRKDGPPPPPPPPIIESDDSFVNESIRRHIFSRSSRRQFGHDRQNRRETKDTRLKVSRQARQVISTT